MVGFINLKKTFGLIFQIGFAIQIYQQETVKNIKVIHVCILYSISEDFYCLVWGKFGFGEKSHVTFFCTGFGWAKGNFLYNSL